MLVAALAFVAVQLLATTHLYATVIVILGIAALVGADIAQIVARVERSAENDFERLAVLGSETPVVVAGSASLTPFERAAGILNAARAERQRQLEYLQTLVDTVAAALIVVEPDGRVTLANRSARAFAGRAIHKLQDIDALSTQGVRHLLALAPGAREIVSLGDGRRVFASVSQFVIPGEPPRRLISLQRIAGELDAVEVKAWQDMADVLTHEMMNSLTPISSLSESLEALLRESAGGREPGEEVAGALEAIKRRSRGLMDFVGRYRAVADLPAPQVGPVHLRDFIRGIDRLMTPVLKERGIAYHSSVTPEDLTCVADPQLLEQAIINLMRNATDAVAGAEAPRVEIKCERADDRVALLIADNGCGVPDARREQIFVPFFTTKSGGSGIGLNLARQVVLAHNGQIDVQPNMPRGSVFRLTLPAAHPG
jgi:signal transduction histidine kinase